MLLFLDLHFLPESDRIRMPFCILDVISLDTPEALVLLDILLHQIVCMIALHNVSVIVNIESISFCNKKDATFWVASVEKSSFCEKVTGARVHEISGHNSPCLLKKHPR